MRKFYPLFLVACLLVFATCKKNDEDPEPEPEPTTVKPLVYQENAVSVPVTATTSTTEDIQNGTMVITDAAVLDKVTTGSILYSNEDDGYLVKVTNVSGSTLTVEPAALDELFQDGDIVFTNANAPDPQKTTAYDFSISRQLVNEGGMTCDVTGTVNFNPTITGDISILTKKFHVNMNNAPLTMTLEMDVNATPDAILNVQKEILLGELSAPATLYGVKMDFKVKLYDRITITGTADINQTLTYTQNHTVSASIAYDNGWTSSFNLENVSQNIDFDANFKTTLQVRHEIIPYVEVMFYGVAGPYLKAMPYHNYNFKGYADVDGDVLWNFNAEYGADAELGVTTRIFKDLSYSKPYTIIPATEFYSAPKKLEIIDGDNQPGSVGQQLAKPFTVKVLDSEDNELEGAMVHFEITEGTGVLSEQKVVTTSGIATVNFTPSTGDNIVVKASIQVADGSGSEIASQQFNVNGMVQLLISGSPWNITANSEDGKNLFSFNNRDTIKCSSLPQDTMVYYERERMKSGTITFGQGSGSISKTFEDYDFNSAVCGQLVITDKGKGESLSGWTYDGATNTITTSNAQYTVNYSSGTLTLTGTKTVDDEEIPVSITATKAP